MRRRGSLVNILVEFEVHPRGSTYAPVQFSCRLNSLYLRDGRHVCLCFGNERCWTRSGCVGVVGAAIVVVAGCKVAAGRCF